MNANVLTQLALNTRLLPEHQRDKILTGVPVTMAEVAHDLAVLALDCEAVTQGDPKSSWTERRLSKQITAAVFLLALSVEDKP